jgi:hypothetical protein
MLAWMDESSEVCTARFSLVLARAIGIGVQGMLGGCGMTGRQHEWFARCSGKLDNVINFL